MDDILKIELPNVNAVSFTPAFRSQEGERKGLTALRLQEKENKSFLLNLDWTTESKLEA
jgi:hypothetical protein